MEAPNETQRTILRRNPMELSQIDFRRLFSSCIEHRGFGVRFGGYRTENAGQAGAKRSKKSGLEIQKNAWHDDCINGMSKADVE